MSSVTSRPKAPLLIAGSDLELLPAKGEATEWELWQSTPLFPHNAAEEEAAAVAVAAEQTQQRQHPPPAPTGYPQTAGPDGEARTGGDTGLEWGTGGVWTEPFDEAAAKETLDRLARHWHRQDLGSSNGQQQPEAGAAPASPLQDSTGRDEADTARCGGEQADGWDNPGRATNNVCMHLACSVQVIYCKVDFSVIRIGALFVMVTSCVHGHLLLVLQGSVTATCRNPTI